MYEFKASDVYDFARAINADVKQKGEELTFKFCPYCNGGSHRDKETFSVNLKTGAYNCFRASCEKKGHFVELARDFNYPLGDAEQAKYRKLPQKKIEVKPKAIEYLESRGISEATTRKYKITTQTKNNNVLVFPFYDENGVLQFVKYRNTKHNGSGSKEWREHDTMPILFGMDHCEDFSTLVITEGQIDSLSIAECGIKNAVSIPSGANDFTWITLCWDWLNKFNEIVVFGDREKGHITLIDTVEKRIKGKIKCVQPEDYLCEKDANDILRKYGKEALIHAVNNAKIREVKHVNRLADIKSVNLKDLPKIKTGIQSLDRVCGGLLCGHVTLLSGKRGEGKSTFMSQMVAEAIDQGFPTFVYSGELPNYHFKAWLDLQIAGSANVKSTVNEYGDKEYYLNDSTIEKINNWYYDKAFIFDNSTSGDDEFTGLIDVITDAVCRYDIKLVCIDNLMTALDDDPQSDIYRQQSVFVKKLEKMAQTYDIAIVLVAHPKKTKGEFNNDAVSGSSDITNAVTFVLNYQRVEGEDYDSQIMLTKNRMTGKLLTGDNSVKLIYDDKSKRIAESSKQVKEYGCFKGQQDEIEYHLELDLPF